jgi:two-component system CheB/CheR fusion protein
MAWGGPGEEQVFLRVVLDQLPVGVVIAEAPGGSVLYANAACERLLQDTAEWAGHGLAFERWTSLRPDGRPYALEERPLRRALAGETVTGETAVFRRVDGSTFVVRAHAAPVRDAGGAVVAAVCAFEDATGEHLAREAMAALNAALEGQVAERTAEVQALTAALSQAEQRERARIAQVLHDDLQQLLYGTRLQVKTLLDDVGALERGRAGEAEHTEAHQALARVHELLGDALRLTRSLTLHLRPPVSAEAGLGASLAWLGRHMQEVHGLRVAVRDGGAPPVPPGVHDLLFQLARELLFNVVKHAGVAEADVALGTEGGALSLSVEDAGRGFDAAALDAAPGEGVGLSSVRERLALLGGAMAVHATPGGGTRIVLTLPLAAASPAAEPPAVSGRS